MAIPIQAPERKKSALYTRFIHLAEVAVFLALACPLLGYFGKLWWFFDLFAHFRFQYLACLILGGGYFLLLRRYRTARLCGAAVLILFLPLAHYYVPHSPPPHLDPIKVISFNINSTNTNFAGIRNFLTTENADVVLLLEASPALPKEVQDLESLYPYQIEHAREDNFGLIVLSKYPFRKSEVHSFGELGLPYVEFEISTGGEIYHFIGIHTLPPIGSPSSAARNDELLDLAHANQASHRQNVIMMGDFNLTPFSRWYGEVLSASGLKDSLRGFGIPPTWMRETLIFAIPIDQMFVSDSLTVLQRTTGNTCGSDHNPLIVVLAKKK